MNTPPPCSHCGQSHPVEERCPHDESTLQEGAGPDPLLGQVLKGAYKVREAIGKGGMGVVYRGIQVSLGRTIAIKMLRTRAEPGSEEVRRFYREARLLSQINHPNVVSLIDFGVTEAGLAFMVMEWLSGRTLEEAVPPGVGLPVKDSLAILEQLGAGVAAAHAIGVVHRDLKPSNVFLLESDGGLLVKVLDFGIAKLQDDRDAKLTEAGTMLGSCGYMAPEQMEGAVVLDARADVYALGSLLYLMLAGQPAFRGKNARSIITRQMLGTLEPIDFAALGKPDGARLMPVLLKAMEREPEKRHQTVEAFLQDLRTAMSASPASPASAPPPPPAAPRSRRGRLVALAALALCLVAGVIVFQSKRQPTTAPSGEVVIGLSAPFSGPSRDLGQRVKVGIEAGIREAPGASELPPVRLIALDDGYEPARALANTRELVEQHKAFALLGLVGTPTVESSLPYALEHRVPFFAPFTGANLARKRPPDPFVFNLRAGYADETAVIVKHLLDDRGVAPEQMAVFAQEDGYGDSGFEGVAQVLAERSIPRERILRVGHPRNSLDVSKAVAELQRHPEVRSVVLISSYRPAAQLIRAMRDSNRDMIFANVSFVLGESLAEELRLAGEQYCEGVIVAQVVPPPEADLPAVADYRAVLRAHFPAEPPTYASLEAYLAARLFREGLRRCGPAPSPETFAAALEGIKEFDLGIDVPVSLSTEEHQALHRVWLTELDRRGKLKPLTSSRP